MSESKTPNSIANGLRKELPLEKDGSGNTRFKIDTFKSENFHRASPSPTIIKGFIQNSVQYGESLVYNNSDNISAGLLTEYIKPIVDKVSAKVEEPYHIKILDRYKAKVEIFFMLLSNCADKYIVSGSLEDFKVALFGGKPGNPIIWKKHCRGGYTEVIYIIMLLHLLTYEDPNEYTGLRIKPEKILELVKRFRVTGANFPKVTSIRTMRSVSKGNILGIDNGAEHTPHRSDTLIKIFKKAFGIDYCIPLDGLHSNRLLHISR